MTRIKSARDAKHTASKNGAAKAGTESRAGGSKVGCAGRCCGPLCKDQRVAVSVRMQS